ncbi:MAG: cofactor-independent phosphoglycerate mutase [Coriobacteriia bacterium]|nr:cofactor-independent phosphoglycerate mutase [Coriobacteriia bacterium]MBN2839703.1 cofactor-independent phosphoglycerate mutase [Coriobacteriia bacterium]
MKHVIVILDGAAGWPLAELGSKTTLGHAHTPNLDALAAAGVVGLAQTVPAGVEPSSSAACTSILGYDPVADYVGRGAIEAASLGVTLAADEIAMRMNLVHIADGMMASYACGHIRTEESRMIVEDLAEALGDETFTFYPGTAYRHILVVKGHPELLDLAYTPPHDISDQPIEGKTPAGDGAELLLDLMDRARGVLERSAENQERGVRGDLPATDIWPFWPGVAPVGLRPFTETRGVKAALTSGVDLLNGLAVLFGIDRLDIPGVTDGSDNDYHAQIEGALDALEDHDLVIVHVEAPDEEGHGGNTEGKVAAIEAIDRDIISVLRDCVGHIRILAMPDHPTPIELKTHVGEPVPFVLAGPGIPVDGSTAYTEIAAAATGRFVDPGRGVMDLLLG